MKILITGSAGFIGYHLAKSLMSDSNFIIGLDNLNSYYDKKLFLLVIGLDAITSEKFMILGTYPSSGLSCF